MRAEVADLARFEIYVDRSLYWRWRLIATNGNIVADGSEAYSNESNCKRAVTRFLALVESASNAPVVKIAAKAKRKR